jgi:hypothetical protein
MVARSFCSLSPGSGARHSQERFGISRSAARITMSAPCATSGHSVRLARVRVAFARGFRADGRGDRSHLAKRLSAGMGWAIDRLCSLIQTRMKLLGLDTVKHEVDIGELLAQYLARREKDEHGGARERQNDRDSD